MRIDIISIFPEYFGPLDLSLIGRARVSGLLDVRVHDLRSWTHDRHNTVDDTPYGGGPGMVMKPEPWGEALDEVVGEGPARLILPTPSGRPFRQADAERLAKEERLVFGCGRYEGIDSRVAADAAERMPVEEVSIGDYVLNGGESATLVMVEAITRLLPGVLGNTESAVQDSFASGGMENLVEGAVYTKPATWRGREVPPVLLSGNHGAVDRWRRDQALRKTARNRPDLVEALPEEALDRRDREVLAEEAVRDAT
ncbi:MULTISPECIES: tRNA (guanosine(37)-N1)-methyltransferase TrmD [Nocardiopsis]|uniref:tRNA (guanine-N(1)-)-methyltransferase n=1 Tax=Nocardiopsis dassonvillei (strain ATCC 23218 / DSM 43111 / CIP 107115 / JCM 7437 / KCTC 9190 / NBRC 14626 / NCTC 10488 / NRRL B-5397 / IMRU 509) TaxID=446468 RepID=D7AUB9_NOCDD|nr:MULTISPECIES: tRNA (guanosine(37)-N1)-methyltransferase TrmD [Nocardiopsis]ADH65677.1 tRNA (guanine-N1)-methyltransferase [Nocardiopsis dassonvillei subsp. dassonvillei DSM 43111]APC34031.1 tRNA (guanosine(37)-N1)-methyltransferase TrmD [Nocardiopsis dassonvillei]MCK9872916.1 tRNA (guanosine(37)-N1)-methyltransferase TrmD [Nocardiopsis dassonvillei]NKY79716.1 tRNA (guanosine(37)-N1)-methyltransferase TrmD [Nocardiopsis dassonvillei]VEI91696.1 tRNA (guanine-N(1)-)-methyltransferase [Nocardio